MTLKAGDSAAALKFIKFGGPLALILFAVKFAIFSKAKKLLFYQILFIGFLAIDLTWFFSCFFIPLLCIKSIEFSGKAVMIIFYFMTCFFNVRLAMETFNARWGEAGSAAFKKTFSPRGNFVNWEVVVRSMNLPAVIFVPGVPKKFESLSAVALVLLMVSGVVFRVISPIISIISLSIPFSICAACCLQIVTYNFLGARALRIIENENDVRLKSCA